MAFWRCDLGSDPVVNSCGPEAGNEQMVHGGCWSIKIADYVKRARRCNITHPIALPYLGFRIGRSE